MSSVKSVVSSVPMGSCMCSNVNSPSGASPMLGNASNVASLLTNKADLSSFLPSLSSFANCQVACGLVQVRYQLVFSFLDIFKKGCTKSIFDKSKQAANDTTMFIGYLVNHRNISCAVCHLPGHFSETPRRRTLSSACALL